MNRAIILLAILLPASAWAQWPTNWPMGDFSGRARALCVYSALTERVTAVNDGVTAPLYPGMFTQRSRLVAYKTLCKSLLDNDYFVDMRRTNSAGRFDGVHTNADGYALLPVLTWTSACAYASVNTNYAGATPMFNLGSDTNLGWVPFKALLNELTATTFDYDGFHSLHDYDTVTKARMTNAFSLYTNDWSGLRQTFIDHMSNSNNWSVQSATNYNPYAFSVVYGIISNRSPSQQYHIVTESNLNTRGTILLRNIATNFNSVADVYLMGVNPNVNLPEMPVTTPSLYTNVWTNAVQSSAMGVIYFFDSIGATNALTRQTREWPIFGNDVDQAYRLPVTEADWSYPTNETTPGSWAMLANPQQRLGFNSSAQRNASVLRWNVTNGFKYVP